ncbi:MAG: hypothetical protein J7L14_02985 [Candidatus Diapherotrites archaeon]|nr:hypothetical protein [Candidatus Diapherotrites archaeon]
MDVLIPIVTGLENNAEFLNIAAKGAKKISLLLVMEREANASRMMELTSKMEEAKKIINAMKKSCETNVEWGDVRAKIVNYALISNPKKICLADNGSHIIRELAKELEAKKFNVERIKVSSP